MPSREEVYTAIQDEIDYAQGRWQRTCEEAGLYYRPDSTKPVDVWLSYIAGYYDDLAYATSHLPGDEALHVFRKLAGLCVSCMLANGVVSRNGGFSPGPVEPRLVFSVIDGERDYQDHLGPDRCEPSERPHEITGYQCMFKTYLDRAINGWTENAGVIVALDNIRKLAGIAVHCMEDHGALRRETSTA